MLIDSHAHLDYEYEISTAALVEEADLAGVKQIISIAASAESLPRVQAIAEQFPNVFFTAGTHPHDAKDFTPEIFQTIQTNAKHPKCVAIGELGLDFFYGLSDKETQFSALQAQLDFSVTVGKPIVLHTRDAEEDTKTFLGAHSKAWHAKHPNQAPGVIHCFTGSASLADFAIQHGYYLSFSGIITFKNADPLRTVVKDHAPIDRILVETDSPFLAPIPHRGKKNHPAYTRVVAEKVAEIKGLSLEELASHTTANTKRLFRF